METIEQRLHIRVAVEVDVGVRVAVAREELLDAQRVGRVHRSDEHDIADPARDELHSPQDEGPHQDLTELRVGLHQRHQLFAMQLDHRARLAHTDPEERAPARDHVDLAGELTGPVDDDGGLSRAGPPDNLDLTRRHDEERHGLVARLDEHLAGTGRALAPVRCDARDLFRRQRRKDVVGARQRRHQGRGGVGHDLRPHTRAKISSRVRRLLVRRWTGLCRRPSADRSRTVRDGGSDRRGPSTRTA